MHLFHGRDWVWNNNLSNAVQPENADLPMLITEQGIEIDFSDVQREKADSPIKVTESGMVIDFNALHTWKVFLLMEATWSGMTIDINRTQPLNAYSPIEATELGITTFLNREQPSNAQLAISVMDSGIVIDVKFTCDLKAQESMTLTVFGILYPPFISGEDQMSRVISLLNKTPSTTFKFWDSPSVFVFNNLWYQVDILV